MGGLSAVHTTEESLISWYVRSKRSGVLGVDIIFTNAAGNQARRKNSEPTDPPKRRSMLDAGTGNQNSR